MKANFTQGPWIVSNDGVLRSASGEVIRFVGLGSTITGGRDFDEAQSNSVLTSAAPELLSALQDMLLDFSACGPSDASKYDSCKAAQAAIAKALGENNE